MKLSQIQGQPHAVKCLTAVLPAGRLGSAYLLYGPQGVGKRTAALAFAQALNCERPVAPGDACESCVHCREIAKGIYGEVLMLGPEEDSERDRSFHTEQISEAVRWATRTAHASRTKVGIMEEVHLMSSEAANHFLKILEEPPPGMVWLLLTSEYHALLPTIRSRCRPVRFTLLSRAVVTGLLAQQGMEQSGKMADLCLGRVDEDPLELQETVAAAEEILALAEKFNLPELCARAQQLGKKDQAPKLSALLDGLELVCASRLRAQPDRPDRWILALDAVGRARWRFRRYAARSLLDSLGAELALVLQERPRA